MTIQLRSLIRIVFIVIIASLPACFSIPIDNGKESTESSILIKNAVIVDGSGEASYRGDVRVMGERISDIGTQLPSLKGERVIDADGLVLAPGFIDMHAHVTNIEEYPKANNFMHQGVTTIANSLHSHDLPWPLDTYTANLKMAPNIAYFAGFNWTRKTVMGLDNRAPTEQELQQMKELVRQAMEQGAFGLSSGMEYVPAAYASNAEVIELAKVAAQWGGIYVTHMRDEGPRLLESITDNAEIAKAAGIPVHINHIKTTGTSNHGKSVEALALIDTIRKSGVDMTTDIYPYAAFMTYSDLLFPSWCLAGGQEDFLKRIKDPAQRHKIEQEMTAIFPQQAGKDFDSIQFESLPHIDGYAGRTLGDYLRDKQQPQTMDAAVKALIELQSQGRFIAIYHSMDEPDIERFLRYPFTMLNTDGDLAMTQDKHYHPRTYGSFPRVLGTYVRERGVLTLEQAIHKMTGQSAQRLGLEKRGVIKQSNYADIVLFDAQTITDHSTYLKPHQYSTGVEYLLINGQPVLEDGQLNAALPGKVLKHKRQ